MSKDNSQKKDRTLVIALVTILGSILVAILTTYSDQIAPILFRTLTPTPTMTNEALLSDFEKLQGTWVGYIIGQDSEVKLIITGHQVEFIGSLSSVDWYKGIATLNEDVTPKQVDLFITDTPIPDYVGKTSHGIYKFEEDTLIFAATEPGNETRPISFNPVGENGVFVLTRQP